MAANEFAIDQLFQDANGDALTYTAKAEDGSMVTPTIAGSRLTLTPGANSGRTVVKVTAVDGRGGSAEANIQVHAVQVAHNKTILTKNGVTDISYDLASYLPAQSALTVYRQEKGALTQDGPQSMNSKVFKTTPGSVGTSAGYWVVANDGTAAFIEVNVQEQQGAGAFFSEYTRGPEGRIALELFNKSESAINYRVVGYRYNMQTQQMEAMMTDDIDSTPYAYVQQIYPGRVGILINYTFYDLMDISPVQAYHGAFKMTVNGNDGFVICAFELIKDGQVIDVIGDKNWQPGSEEPFPVNGTLIRKKGIATGSPSFNPSGEWDVYPLTYMNLDSHTP